VFDVKKLFESFSYNVYRSDPGFVVTAKSFNSFENTVDESLTNPVDE
jgi:hypothetical protein